MAQAFDQRTTRVSIAPGEGRLSVVTVTNAPANPGETAEDALRRRLTETAEKEVWNGATLIGPHRDDIAFQLNGRDLAGFASRGQQRTAILAWKLAQLDLLSGVSDDPPLLLLDDVFSELDPERRAHLVRRAVADLAAVVEHHDVVGEVHHHADVVLDQYHGGAELAVDVEDEAAHFSLLLGVLIASPMPLRTCPPHAPFPASCARRRPA